MKVTYHFTPKGKVWIITKNVPSLMFHRHNVLEFDRELKRYIPKNRFGEKVVTIIRSYSTSQVRLMQIMEIVKPVMP